MKKTLLFSAILAIACLQPVPAQNTVPAQTMFSWGAAHLAPGQALSINVTVPEIAGTLPVSLELSLTDKAGNVVYRNLLTATPGRTVSFAIGPDIRSSIGGIIGPDIRATIPADIYAIVGPDVRVIMPSLKITFPPGPTAPHVDRLPTLELMDATAGRVLGFGPPPNTINIVI
jgi:hypothetical protein